MILILARHGETTWNLAGRYQGRLESALSSLGMRQAHALSDATVAFRPAIARVVASPLLRCTATALPSAERLGCDVEIDERLIEIGHGSWEGKLRDEIARDDPQGWYLWKNEPAKMTFSAGDSILHVAERWRSFASEPVRVPTLAVTHDAVVRAAIALAQERSLDDIWDVTMENAAFAVFDASQTPWRLSEPFVAAHLDGLRADVSSQAL